MKAEIAQSLFNQISQPYEKRQMLKNICLLFAQEFGCYIILADKNNEPLFEDNSEHKSGDYELFEKLMSGADTIGSATIKRADLPFNDLELQAFYFFISVISLLVKFIDEKNMGNTERVKAAIGALSYSELVAALHVIEKINGQSGNFVSSHISAEKNISKSAIVNSLKKLESAGLIEVRSLGVKGTFVHFLNEALAVELKKLKH